MYIQFYWLHLLYRKHSETDSETGLSLSVFFFFQQTNKKKPLCHPIDGGLSHSRAEVCQSLNIKSMLVTLSV